LEKVNIRNTFFRKGIQLCVDGREVDEIRKMLTQETELAIQRQGSAWTLQPPAGTQRAAPLPPAPRRRAKAGSSSRDPAKRTGRQRPAERRGKWARS